MVRLAEAIRDIDQQFAAIRVRYMRQLSLTEKVIITDAAASLLRVDVGGWHNEREDMLATLHILSELNHGNILEEEKHSFLFSRALAKICQ